MPPFEGSDNKAIIRLQWDLPIVQKWANQEQRLLSYFGLPGPKIKDILAWKDYLGACTGVERLRMHSEARKEDLNIHRQLLANVAKHDIQGFQLMRGMIEDIILQGVDLDQSRPKLISSDHPLVASYHYDIVNLDFLGGIGARDKNGESRRVRAIKKMIERQRRHSYILIITINVRDRIDDELDRYLVDTSRNHSGSRLSDILMWYKEECREGLKEYRLKAAVPLFIRSEAEQCGSKCFCYPPIVYEGDGRAKMVHFVFEMRHTPSIFPAYSDQKLADVVNLALLAVKQNTIKVVPRQHPGFDYESCEAQLVFLPSTLRDTILMNLPVNTINDGD